MRPRHRALHLHSRFHQIDNEAAHRSVPPAPRLRLHQRLVLPRVSRRQRHRHPAHARRRQRRRHRRREQSIGADAEGDAVPTRANCLHRGRRVERRDVVGRARQRLGIGVWGFGLEVWEYKVKDLE